MDNPRVNQEGNVVIGNQAGRDININNAARKPTCMANLVEQLKKEREGNQTFDEIIEGLQRYRTVVAGEKVEGLEPKLIAGNRKEFVEYAIRAKEQFVKKLAKYEIYKAAQEIFVYLLAEIYVRFNDHVYPAILNNAEIMEVNKLIRTEVVSPVTELLEENELQIYAEEINGMIFFLTGNCYIKWV